MKILLIVNILPLELIEFGLIAFFEKFMIYFEVESTNLLVSPSCKLSDNSYSGELTQTIELTLRDSINQDIEFEYVNWSVYKGDTIISSQSYTLSIFLLFLEITTPQVLLHLTSPSELLFDQKEYGRWMKQEQ